MAFYLYIMRHAKSDWSGPGGSDFERGITGRGRKNAKRIGQWLQEHDHIPDKIVSSPAVRAKETLAALLSRLEKKAVVFDEQLYLADLERLLTCIERHKSDAHSLLLLAHNPGLSDLARYLSDRSDSPASGNDRLGTANLVIFRYAANTFDPDSDRGERLAFIKPGELD